MLVVILIYIVALLVFEIIILFAMISKLESLESKSRDTDEVEMVLIQNPTKLKGSYTKDEVDLQFKLILAHITGYGDLEYFTYDKQFITDLEFDSLDLADLQNMSECTFNIEVSESDYDSLKTIGEAINYIKNKLKQN